MKKTLTTIAWLVLAVAALAFLAWRTPRQQFEQAVNHIDWFAAVAALVLYTISQGLLAIRWLVLLRVHQVMISLPQAIRLTFLGLFYNNVMPGSVGGDVLKAWYVTRHSKSQLRLEAAVTVFVDRVAGLTGMVLVGGIASLFLRDRIVLGKIDLRWIIWGLLAVMVVGGSVFFSQRIRRAFSLSGPLRRLPFAAKLHQIDQAVRLYRSHPKAVVLAILLTAVIQGGAILSIWILTQALHFDKVSLVQCLIIMPIIWVISAAIPVPGGLGIIENSVTYLFCLVIDPSDPAGSRGEAAALALLLRLVIAGSSLPGALVPLFGGHLPKAEEMAAQMKEAQNEANET